MNHQGYELENSCTFQWHEMSKLFKAITWTLIPGKTRTEAAIKFLSSPYTVSGTDYRELFLSSLQNNKHS